MPTNIRFKGLTATTVALNADRFQGRIAYDSTLSRFVVSPDGTAWAVMARRDVLETFAAGIQDSTLTVVDGIVGAGTSGRLQNYSGLSVVATTGSARTFVLGSGSLAGQPIQLQLNGITSQSKRIFFRTGSVHRWAFGADSDAESGSNAGSRLVLESYTDGGTLIDNPLTVVRASAGLITIGGSTLRPVTNTGTFTSQGRIIGTASWTNGQANFGSTGQAGKITFNRGNDGSAQGELGYLASATEANEMRLTSNGGGSTIAFWIGGSEKVKFNNAGDLQLGGVTCISSTRVGSLTTLSTSGLATLAQATVSDLTTGRMVSTTTAGRLQALDAAGSRALIGIGNGTEGAITVIQDGLNTPPGSPVVGVPYLIGGTPTGAWSANANQLGTWSGSAWGFAARPFWGTCFDLTGGTLISGVDGAGLKYLYSQNIGCAGTSSATTFTGTNFNGSNGTFTNLTANSTAVKTVSSTTEALNGNIYNQYTTVTQTGIVTQQSLAGTGAGSRAIGAGRLNTLGAGIELYLCGTYTTDAAPGNATIRIRIGSTTFRTIGSFALDPSITGGVWYIRGRITTRTTGATGTVGGQLMWEHQASSVAGSQVMHIETATSSADVTVDLTAAQTIDVDWTATDAGTSIVCTCFSINAVR